MGMKTKSKSKIAYAISVSLLNSFIDCPRCFWLEINKGIKKPEKAMSKLSNGMDFVIKNIYDYFRKDGLPPELRGKLPGKLLPDINKVKEFRSRNKAHISEDIILTGALDDVLELDDGTIVPLDNKTKGFPQKKEIHPSYINQLNCYTYILRENGYKTVNLGYLVFWFLDHKNMDHSNPMKFNIKIEEVKTDPDIIKPTVLRAVDCLKGEIPEPGVKLGEKGEKVVCKFCEYHRKLTEASL